MAQAAYSRIAYPDAACFEPADPHGAYAQAAYAGAGYAGAPYPSAMRRARRRRTRLTALASFAAITVAGWAVLTQPHGQAPVRPEAEPVPRAAAQEPASKPAPRPSIAWMLDPSPALGSGAAAFGRAAPPVPAFRVAAAEPSAAVREIARRVARDAQAKDALAKDDSAKPAGNAAGPVRMAEAAPTPAAIAPSLVPTFIPLPVARPPELRRPLAAPAPRVAARALPRTRDVFRAAIAEEPSFFEKLFGGGGSEAPRRALAYASPDPLPQESPRARVSPSPETSPSAGVAVYDITARTVTLPSGEVLEAHSGLGQAMDDPRYVHLRMRGSTPPGTYDLTERERLFHGVRAIRLNPVGGSAAVHGRDGLLAHTYMLRQPGASNGCVSFRDYDRFLQAFLRGEVRRLVVVAGGRGDFFGRRIGMSDRAGGGA